MVDKQNKSLKGLDKETIANIFEGLIDSINKGERDSNLYKYFEDIASSFSLYGDDIYFHLITPYEICLRTYIQDILEKKGISKDKLYIYSNILVHFNFYENHIRELITKKFGSICCVDQTHTIINEYLYFLKTGEKRYDLANKRACYSIPKDYDPDFWFEVIEGLYDLQFGNPTKYLKIITIYCSSFSNMEKAEDSK